MNKCCNSSGEPTVEASDEAPNDENQTAINDPKNVFSTKLTTEEFTNLITPEVLSCITILFGVEHAKRAAFVQLLGHAYVCWKRCKFDSYRKKHQEESYKKDRQIMLLKQQNQAKAEELKLFTQIKDGEIMRYEQQVQQLHGDYQEQLKDKDQSHQEQLKDKDLLHQEQLKDKDNSYQKQLKDKDNSYQKQLKDKDNSHQKQLEDKDHFYQRIIQDQSRLLQQNNNFCHELIKDQFYLMQHQFKIRKTDPQPILHFTPRLTTPFPTMQTNDSFTYCNLDGNVDDERMYGANKPLNLSTKRYDPFDVLTDCAEKAVPNHPVSDSDSEED